MFENLWKTYFNLANILKTIHYSVFKMTSCKIKKSKSGVKEIYKRMKFNSELTVWVAH